MSKPGKHGVTRKKRGKVSSNPSIKSSLTFLRKTPWARTQVEELFVKLKLYQKS